MENLPFVTMEFGELLKQSETEDETPSCSLAEALEKQDLYINSVLAQIGSSLLWNLFRNGLTENRIFFSQSEKFQNSTHNTIKKPSEENSGGKNAIPPFGRNRIFAESGCNPISITFLVF